MLGKLKDMGNTILGKFGLSLNPNKEINPPKITKCIKWLKLVDKRNFFNIWCGD